MRSGESILIHSGSGGVGQAAIAIALSMNCIVYTTVGSEEKKTFLMKQFPQVELQSYGFGAQFCNVFVFNSCDELSATSLPSSLMFICSDWLIRVYA